MAGGASELLGRESCAGPLLVGLSWGKPQLFHLPTGDESMGLRAYVEQTQNA